MERYTHSIFPTKNSNRKDGIDIKTKTNNNKQSRDRNQDLKNRKCGSGGPGAQDGQSESATGRKRLFFGCSAIMLIFTNVNSAAS